MIEHDPIPIKSGYEYIVDDQIDVPVPEFKGIYHTHPFYAIHSDHLIIRHGYAYDGLTFARDTNESLRAALIHDIACQAWNEGAEPSIRSRGDEVFSRIMAEDGEIAAVRWWRHQAVKWATRNGTPKPPKPTGWLVPGRGLVRDL